MEGKEFDSFISFKTFLDQYSKENNTVYCIADWLVTAGLPNIQIKDCLKIQNHFQQSLNIHNAKYVCKHFGKQKKSESNYI